MLKALAMSPRPAVVTRSAELSYQWQRYREQAIQRLRDRLLRAKSCPMSHPPEVVEKILHLRYQYHFGPGASTLI